MSLSFLYHRRLSRHQINVDSTAKTGREPLLIGSIPSAHSCPTEIKKTGRIIMRAPFTVRPANFVKINTGKLTIRVRIVNFEEKRVDVTVLS
jgi:hypothetical protein